MKKLVSKCMAFMAVAVLGSCSASGTYYQLVSTKPIGNLKKTDDSVIFEDSNCKISYYLWADGGSTCIKFENKTDEDIYLDMTASFYFMNNQAFDLYNGATTSNSTTTTRGNSVYWGYGISTGKNETTNSTVVTQQQQIVTIPARMYKIIGETDVTILGSLYRDCNLFLTPSKKSITSSTFTQEDSPFTFGLRLTYYVGKSQDAVRVKNMFYVDKFTNYPQKLFREYFLDRSYACPDETVYGESAYKYNFVAPDAFYLEYNPQTLNGGNRETSRKH